MRTLRREAINTLLIVAGIFSAGMGLKRNPVLRGDASGDRPRPAHVEAHDHNAFVVQHPLADVRGGVVRRPALP